LTGQGRSGIFRSESPKEAALSSQGKDPNKKHRHDVGQVDHEPENAEAITRGIQVVLGAIILFTAGIMVYAVVVAGGGVG
jgi:hypothetical protein